MVTVEQQIVQQRASIEQAQARARESAEREKISRSELLQRKGLMDFAQRKALQQRKAKAVRQQLEQIKSQQKTFETQVAQVAPKYAQKQYLESSYKVAKQDFEKKVKEFSRKIKVKQDYIAREKARGDYQYVDQTKDDIEGLRKEQRAYVEALAGGKEALVKGYYSGRTSQLSSFAGSQYQAKLARHAQEKAFAEAQGFKSYSELQRAIKAQKLDAVISPAAVSGIRVQVVGAPKLDVQPRGTYDPSTSSYISPEGRGMTIRQEDIPIGTKIIGAPPTALPAIFQPGYVSPELRKVLPPEAIQRLQQVQIQQHLETKRYQDLGYTHTESQRLATASLAKGGVTFTPKEARRISRLTISEKVPGALRDVGAGVVPTIKEVFTKGVTAGVIGIGGAPPILEREIAPVVLGVGPYGIRAPTGITYGEALAAPAKAVEFAAVSTGEMWTDVYAGTISKLPPEWQPSQVLPGKEEEYKKLIEDIQKGKIDYRDVSFEGIVVPITPEQFGAGIETVVKLAPYATPAAIPYIGSEFFKGVQTVRHPEAEAKRIFQEQILDPYKEQYAEAQRTLEPGYELESKLTTAELRAEYMPGIIEQVKFGGAVEAGTSLAFLGGIGAFKAGRQIIRTTVPRGKYLGMTERQYQVAVEEAEKQLVKLGKQDIAWIGKVEKEAGKVFIRGEQKLGKLKRDIKVYGEIKETELGKVFIPYGRGEVAGGGEILLGKKKIPYQYLEVQKFEVGADAITIRAGELIGSPKLIKKIPSKIKLLRESALIPERMKPMFVRAEEALAKEIKVIPEAIAKAETFEILGKTVTVPRAGAFALYRVKPKYLTPSAKLERAIRKQMKENIFFGGDVVKEIVPQVAIKLKPKKFLVVGKKEAGLFFVEEAKREVKYGMKIVGGVKTPFAVTYAEVKPVLVKLPKIPKPPKPTKLVAEVKPVEIGKPVMVGGVGLEVIPKPTYAPVEVEVGAMFLPPVTKPVVIPTIDIVTKPSEIITLKVPTITREKIKLVTVPKVGERFKYETALGLKRVAITKFMEVQIPREVLRERLALKERLISRLAEVQIQREALRQVPITRPVVVPKPRIRIKPPKIKIPIKLRGPRIKKKVTKLRKPVPRRGYTFEIRRRGKWQRAKLPFAFATETGAEAIAQEKVLKEAAASYRVVEAKKGKRVVRTRKKPSAYRKVLFRKGKEPGVMVQKKLLRILSPGEKEQISYAGGLARMKKAKTSFYKQPIKKVKKKKKVVKKKKK